MKKLAVVSASSVNCVQSHEAQCFKMLFTQMVFLGKGEEPKAPKGEFQGSLSLWEPEW